MEDTPPPIIDSTSFIVAGMTFVFSLFLFYSDTDFLWKSAFVALEAAALVWVSYVLVRWLYLALRG